jgi:Tol biopolymer transport system component
VVAKGVGLGPIEISPDNKLAILTVLASTTGALAGTDLWLMELPSGVLWRLTSETEPVWSPDSRRIAFIKADKAVDPVQARG